jgi:redox-sensing transcriptional repressor
VIGKTASGLQVRHLDELKDVVVDEGISIGIIATPPAAAQEVGERLVDAGIKSILNFAPAVVNLPPDVNIRKVDLSIELQILSFYQQRTQAIAAAREATRKLGPPA